MLLGWKMLLRCKFRCCLQKGGGGVITSCEVRWMMLNPGRCCLVGRCCYVASFVVVYRRGGGVGHGMVLQCIITCSTSEQNDQNKGTAPQMVSMFHTSLVVHGRCKIFLFQHGQTSSSSMKMELRLIKPFQRKT